jgi:ElaB protein
MESTFDGTAEQVRTSGRRLQEDLSSGVSDIKAAATNEIKGLIADVEDLIARIADLKDADVVRVRSKVQRAVDATKQSLADGADTIRQHAQNAANTADSYVRESPWQAVGIAALVGAVVGILATRRS